MEQKIEQTSRTNETGGSADVLGLRPSRAWQHKILSRQEEGALATRIRQGDDEAWEHLVRHNLRLVVSIARRYSGQGLEFSDLVQEGNLGLMRAARGFDPSFGTKFSTYATWWIKQAMGRAVSNKASPIRLPVHAAEEERALNGARERLRAASGGREPTVEELSGSVGKSSREVREILSARKSVVSYDVAVGPEEDGSLSELLADEAEANTEELFMEDALKDSIHGLLAKLPERERYVVERRYGLDNDGRCATLGEVSEEIGVTRERVRQIQNSALRKLRSIALEAELESFLESSLSPA